MHAPLLKRIAQETGGRFYAADAVSSRGNSQSVRLAHVAYSHAMTSRGATREPLMSARWPAEFLQELAHCSDLVAETCPIPGFQSLHGLVVVIERLLRVSCRGPLA